MFLWLTSAPALINKHAACSSLLHVIALRPNKLFHHTSIYLLLSHPNTENMIIGHNKSVSINIPVWLGISTVYYISTVALAKIGFNGKTVGIKILFWQVLQLKYSTSVSIVTDIPMNAYWCAQVCSGVSPSVSSCKICTTMNNYSN